MEMLLSISFAVKDAMLDWEWLGIDEKEWPPQRLDWEMYRIDRSPAIWKHRLKDDFSNHGISSMYSIKVYGMPRVAATARVPYLLQW